ncbi:hypothetical protein NF418_00680 [Streptococcus suis]|uniref:hypothetical protein n=1 Tax=Streptococcus suis TaxID=1307 RepID=UPI00211797B5|nr:hypothetical protein [Streptococcus suis]
MISEKVVLDKMGFACLELFCKKIGVSSSNVIYLEKLGWFIVNNLQPDIPYVSIYSAMDKCIPIVYQKQEQKKATEIVAILKGGNTRTKRKRKKLKPITPLALDSDSFRIGHLLAHSILEYVQFEDGQGLNCFHRYNLFYETREANEFTNKGFEQDVMPQRLLEIIIENAIGMVDYSKNDSKGSPEKKRLREFYNLLREKSLIPKDGSYEYYHLPKNKKLIFYSKLIYNDSSDPIPSAIHLQSKSDDIKLYFNVIIPNIKDSKYNFQDGTDIL